MQLLLLDLQTYQQREDHLLEGVQLAELYQVLSHMLEVLLVFFVVLDGFLDHPRVVQGLSAVHTLFRTLFAEELFHEVDSVFGDVG